MSITAYKVEAVGHDRTGEDYGYVNIMYRYGNKQPCPRPDQCETIEEYLPTGRLPSGSWIPSPV